MKRVFAIGILFILLLPLAALSCTSSGGGNIKATLGQEFTLPAGGTANFDTENLSIQFVAVTADSRCPQYAKCVTAGEAKCQMRFEIYGSPADMTLTQTGGTAATGTDYFLNYKVSYKLEPYPEVGKTIAPSGYRLVMTVTKPQ